VDESRTPVSGAFTPVALIFILGLVGGVTVNLVLPVPIWPGVWVRLVGLAPLAVGALLFAWARSAFRHHQTSLMPWSPSTALVQDGPYSFSRNPIYLAFCTMYLGVSLVFNSGYVLVMLLVVLVLFDRTQIPREERYLEAKFGDEYTTYKAKVRRWV
jgi:protein-S-isoprenylcysteine O-methyltransferase Ste14